MYDNGQGVAQDYKEAVRWYKLLPNENMADAEYSLGLMYANGKGVTRVHAEAARWYRRAADHRNLAEAQYDLGVLYDKGQGVPQDYREAARWYQLAADEGYEQAQFNLGRCTSMAKASRRMMGSPRISSKWPPRKASRKPNTTWACCTPMARAFRVTRRKRRAGTGRPPSRAIEMRNSISRLLCERVGSVARFGANRKMV